MEIRERANEEDKLVSEVRLVTTGDILVQGLKGCSRI
jgi:hypothetical protein